MSKRQISRPLRWAKRLESRPKTLPEPKNVRGAKLKGLQYERQLAKALGSKTAYGTWWEFEDAEGRGFCQTDLLGFSQDFVLVLEVKYTWTEEAEEELFGLYLPVVAKALDFFPSKVLPIVVCKKLTPGFDRKVCSSLAEAAQASYYGASARSGVPVWHHLGGVPLLRSPSPTPIDFGAHEADAFAQRLSGD